MVDGADKRLQQMLKQLRERGQRITPQRLAILRVLAASQGHPSVDEIYEQIAREFPTTSLATVYKTVTLLKEMGEVLELEFSGSSNRYDGNRPYPHPHLICTRCGSVIDPDVPDFHEWAEGLARANGYRLTHHRIDLYGICPQCRGEGE